MKWMISKVKKPTHFWIICVFVIMLLYTVSCFFIIDRYANPDSEEALLAEKLTASDANDPPEISISVDDTYIDYLVEKTNWEGEVISISEEDVIDQVKKDKLPVPTIYIGSLSDMQHKSITVDFKKHRLPDEIHLHDVLISGSNIKKDTAFTKALIETVNEHEIIVPLRHHANVMLSSNMRDYEKNYRRLFRLICTWGENTCHYIFMVNTSGKL